MKFINLLINTMFKIKSMNFYHIEETNSNDKSAELRNIKDYGANY